MKDREQSLNLVCILQLYCDLKQQPVFHFIQGDWLVSSRSLVYQSSPSSPSLDICNTNRVIPQLDHYHFETHFAPNSVKEKDKNVITYVISGKAVD